MLERLYLVVCGAVTAYRVPALIASLLPLTRQLLTLPTPDSSRLISLRDLARIERNRVVTSYFATEMLPRPAVGAVLVAPCTFNTLHKLAAGMADNLPLSLTQEAIGRGWPVVVAPSLNEGLWAHPQTPPALARLQEWGVSLALPSAADEYTLAPDAQILAALHARLGGGNAGI